MIQLPLGTFNAAVVPGASDVSVAVPQNDPLSFPVAAPQWNVVVFTAPAGSGGGPVVVTWDDVEDKPVFGTAALADVEDFAPASHTQNLSTITGVSHAHLLGRHATGTGAAQPIGLGNGLGFQGGNLAVQAPTTTTLGGVKRNTGAAGQYVTGISTSGDLEYGTPAGGGASNIIWVGAGEWIPRVTAGAGIDGEEFSTNRQNLDYLAFDAGVAEFAQVWLAWPGAFSTFTATFYWTSASGSGSVVWQARARGYVDDDAIDQAFGTAQSVTDTLLSANDVHQSASTAAVTPAGTVSAGRLVCFGIGRDATNGSDTLAVDARLIGVRLEFAA